MKNNGFSFDFDAGVGVGAGAGVLDVNLPNNDYVNSKSGFFDFNSFDTAGNENIELTQKTERYKNSMEAIPFRIFSDLNSHNSSSSEKFDFTNPHQNINSIFYNRTGYAENNSSLLDIPCIIGTTISLDEQTPIGYNIHIPKGELMGILVQVYGGESKKERATELYKPGDFSREIQSVLNKNIVVITLNLVNWLELGECRQNEMEEKLHHRMHASINKMYEILSVNPCKGQLIR